MMANAPDMGSLFDWSRQDAMRQIEARRRGLRGQLAQAKPRTERYLMLRGEMRALTLQQLRLGVWQRHD